MSDLASDDVEIGKLSKAIGSSVAAAMMTTITKFGNAMSGAVGFGSKGLGNSGKSMMPTSMANMSVNQLLSRSMLANSMFSGAIGTLQMGQGVIAGAGAMMPSVSDTVNRATGYYNAGRMAGTSWRGLSARTFGMMGGNLTQVGADATVAQSLVGQGIDPSSKMYANLARSTANAAKYLNMDNGTAAQALGGLTSGGTSQALMRNFGMYTTNPMTGQTLSPTQIFSQLNQRFTGGQKLTRKDIMTSLHGGALAVNIQNSGLDSNQQGLLAQYMLDAASGKNMDLGNQKIMDQLTKEAGGNPALSQYQINSAQTGAMQTAQDAYIKGMQQAVGPIKALETAAGKLAKQFGTLNAFLQTVGGDRAAQGGAVALGGIGQGIATIAGAKILNNGLSKIAKQTGLLGGTNTTAVATGRAKSGKIRGKSIAGRGAKPGAPAATGATGATKGFGKAGKFLGKGLRIAGGGMTGAFAGGLANQGVTSLTGNSDAGYWTGMAAAFGTAELVGGAETFGLSGLVGAGMYALGNMDQGAQAWGDLGKSMGMGGAKRTIGTGTVSGPADGSIKFARPCGGSITCKWGTVDNMHPNGHHGTDFGVSAGTIVQAAAAGTVLRTQWSDALGNTVEIDHGNNLTTFYAHLQSYSCKPGDKVQQGQEIARSGNTGSQTTGAHLHFEIRRNGTSIDPSPYLGPGVAVIAAGVSSDSSSNSSGTSATGAVADSANSLGFNSGKMEVKSTVPQSYTGAAVSAASGTGSQGGVSLGRGKGVRPQVGGNTNMGGGPGGGMHNNFVINMTIAQASESEARKFAAMIKGYLDDERLTMNMGAM